MAFTQKQQFAKMVCLFLAESLRTKHIGINRAAEIAEKVLVHLNLLDTEADFLKLVKELAHDFEELVIFENQLLGHKVKTNRRELESTAKELAIHHLGNNPDQALAILKDACQEGMTVEKLRSKYPSDNNKN